MYSIVIKPQLDAEYRILLVDGVVSSQVYRLKRTEDQRLIVIVESSNGTSHRVHLERLIPADCYEKEIIIDKVLKTVCRHCGKLSDIVNGYANCDCGQRRLLVRRCSTSEKDLIMTNSVQAVVDLEFVASHGTELWGKESKFDHVATEAKSFALLADNPPRKLCFQTYNGSLGKKVPDLKRLGLDAFKDNANSNGKPPWSILKSTLDEERKKLQTLGYVIMEFNKE